MPSLLENPAREAALTPQWSDAPAGLGFEHGDIHVWRARLDDPRLLALAKKTLSLGEIMRGERCASSRERERCLAQRALLRTILARYVGVPAQDLRFTRDAFGRPALALSTLRFNVSSAEDVALLAVTASQDIGLEIEHVRHDLPFDDMAAHYFEPEDQWSIRTTHCQTQKALRFFDFWTTNEATLQASVPTGLETLLVHRLCPADGFAAAIAVAGKRARLAFWNWR